MYTDYNIECKWCVYLIQIKNMSGIAELNKN